MKKFFLFIFLLISMVADAQNNRVEAVLDTLKKNSLLIKVAFQNSAYQALENRDILFLENPEVEFNYLFGDEESGNRRDFSVMQSFKAQDISGLKFKMVNSKNKISAYEYDEAVRDFELEARNVLIDFVIANTLLKKYAERTELSRKLVEAEKRRLDLGEASVMEYHKAEMYLATVGGLQQRLETDLVTLAQEVMRLNGGVSVPVDIYNWEVSDLGSATLIDDFEAWYQEYENVRPLVGASASIESATLDLKSARMDWIPEISVGYMQEVTDVEKFRGVATQFSMPIWSNRRNVGKKKIEIEIAKTQELSAKNDRYSQKRVLFERCKSLKNLCDYYHESLDKFGDIQTVYKALHGGEISLIEFINECDMYYEFFATHLESERERLKAEAELMR